MSSNAIGNLSSSYLQQALVIALQSAGITPQAGRANGGTSTRESQSDSSQLSPFAQLANTLRGHAAEFGVIAAKGISRVASLLEGIEAETTIPLE